METIIVQDSLRKKKRELKDALGDDILRYIAEIVTNSDDSYRRLEAKGINNKENNIYIELDTLNDDNIITITDNAEGMSTQTLKNIFSTYGADNAGGKSFHARGIFGQGASDVLRAAANEKKVAYIETIKDGVLAKLTYNMSDELVPSINIGNLKLKGKALEEYRLNNKIPKDGTKVVFGIPSTVKFTKKIKESLPSLIEKYPTFRYLLNQKNRNVIYLERIIKQKLSSKKYLFNEEKQILNKKFTFTFEEEKIECQLKLYINELKKEDGTNIIVRDENYNVFDNTMFDFLNAASAQNISGELLIKNLYNLCYEHLNSKDPDAIVRDNRTGFDTKNPFYIALSKKINPILESTLETFGKDIKTTNITNNKKFNDALKKLNKYLASEINEPVSGGNIKGSIIPPLEGLKFSTSKITITKDKSYNIKLLINSDIVSVSDEINIDVDVDGYVNLSTYQINYKIEDIKDGIVIKNITIKGLKCTKDAITITATCNNKKATLLVEVTNQDIHYPDNGFAFVPNSITSNVSSFHYLKLYVSTDIIPLSSVIKVSSKELNVFQNIVVLESSHLLNDTIGMINITLSGGELGKSYLVTAECNGISTSAEVTIIEPNKNDSGNSGGLIAGFRLEPSNSHKQAYYNEHTHMIMINSLNSINIHIMGSMKDKDADNPVFNKEQQKYLCDIIASQAAKILVREQNIKRGEINFEDNLLGIEKMDDLLQEHKNKIYEELYAAIVTSKK